MIIIDEFSELVEEAGYSDGLSIVMKFRRADRNFRTGMQNGARQTR